MVRSTRLHIRFCKRLPDYKAFQKFSVDFNFDEEILGKGADFFEKLAENFQ